MIVTKLTRCGLAIRREERALSRQGYRRHETDWEIHRGGREVQGYVILDAKISVCGKYVWTKIGPRSATEP